MIKVIRYEAVESKIIEVRGQKVIIDNNVASLYNVETREINQAVKNNPEKFPEDYILELTKEEWAIVKSKNLISPFGGGKVRAPKAFTEKGLYMLATILKSAQATQTTLAIIDTFAQVKEAERIISRLSAIKENSPEQQKLTQRAGEIISELVMPGNIDSQETEASVELNLAVVKLKYSIKKKN